MEMFASKYGLSTSEFTTQLPVRGVKTASV
jgi:hypothetical protein